MFYCMFYFTCDRSFRSGAMNYTHLLGVMRVYASKDKNNSVAVRGVGPGNGETRTSCLFARCRCDAARKARRYCARCNSTAAVAADGAAIAQCTD